MPEASRRPVACIVDASIDVTGAFISARAAAHALADDVDVHIVLPAESAIPDDALGGFAGVHRLPIATLNRTVAGVVRYLPGLADTAARLARLLNDLGADVLQFNDFYLAYAGPLRALGYRGRIVTLVRMDPRRYGALATIWLAQAHRWSDRVVAISAFVRRQLPAAWDVALVYDPVRTAMPDLERLRDAQRLVFLGNYIRGKGQEHAVAAFAQVAGRFPEARLDFYGGDMGLAKNREFRAELQSAIDGHGLQHRVTLHGFVSDTATVLQSSRIALNFSQSEAFSLTCLEAAANGCALVATRCGGPEEIVVHGETGLLVPVGDLSAMAEAITELLAHPERTGAMGEGAARHVREVFSLEKFRAGLLDAYVPGGRSRVRRVLYVSYDGMEEPLGRSQVLPYLEGLVARGHHVELLSFEKPGVPLWFRRRLASGIVSTRLRYHHRPSVPATALDMAAGAATADVLVRAGNVDLVHVRSYVPGAMVLPVVEAHDLPLVFDTRGLWADEKVDGGDWGAGSRRYGAAKQVERALFVRADAITVLTERFRRWLREGYPHRDDVGAPIAVIPTCADLEVFRPDVAPLPTLAVRLHPDARVLVYVGSLSGRYLVEDMARFYLAWRRAAAELGRPSRLLVVSRDTPERFLAVLRAAGCEDELVHTAAGRDEVAGALRCAHAGVFFYRPLHSTIGCMPTKLGEILAVGLPVVGNAIADLERILSDEVGVVVRDLDDATLDDAARSVLALAETPSTAEATRARACAWFDLAEGVAAYDALYRRMPPRHGRAGRGGAEPAALDATWPASAAPSVEPR